MCANGDGVLVLVTGRRLQHGNAGTRTRRTGDLERNDRDDPGIHSDDADGLWISDGDTISVRSRVGRIELSAQVTDRIERGHFPESRTNVLVGASPDVNTSRPDTRWWRPTCEEATMKPALA